MGWVIPTKTQQEQEVVDSHLKQLPRIDWLEHYRNVEAPFARLCESLTDLDKLTVFSLPVGIANRWIEYIIRKEDSSRPSSWLTQDAPEINPSCFVSHIHVKCTTTFLSAALLALPFLHHYHNPYCFDDLWLLQSKSLQFCALPLTSTDGYKILNISNTAWEEVYIDASFFASGSDFHANVLSLWQVPVHFLFDLCTIYIFFYDVKKIKYGNMVWWALFDIF